jgi:hypothetical protein
VDDRLGAEPSDQHGQRIAVISTIGNHAADWRQGLQ